ncbi:MAG: hypothetical protein NTZ05_07390, partial [Chloroflexi bacterium]|nr:hypothetical protein [Chloroflexota bacterium]
AGVVDKFHLLKLGLSAILAFVGAKMLLIDLYKIPIGLSLGVIGGILALAVVLSLMYPKKEEHAASVHTGKEDERAG